LEHVMDIAIVIGIVVVIAILIVLATAGGGGSKSQQVRGHKRHHPTKNRDVRVNPYTRKR